MSRVPHVAIDLGATARDRVTGWERFAADLARALINVNDPRVELHVLRPSVATRSRWSNLVVQLVWGAVGLPRSARGYGLIHYPTYPPIRRRRPAVWTVHDDLILGGHPEHARSGASVLVPLGRRAVGFVDVMVATTQSVAADLMAIGVPEERLAVIRPGVPELPPPSVRPPRVAGVDGEQRPIPQEFVLTVGTLEDRKRPWIAAAAARRVGVPIVFVGALDATFDLDRLRGSRVLLAGRVTDAELAYLYSRASALIAPSAYEGFDFPLSEAMSVGLPVAASDIPVHREVAGGSVTLFAVDDEQHAGEALAAAVARQRTDGEPLPTWEACARAYLGLYARVMGET